MRRILKALLYTALGSTALAGLALALVPTPLGESLIQRFANDALDLPDGGARLEGLSISWSGNASLASLTLTDSQGPYATVSGIALEWQPLALLTGQMHITGLAADLVDLQRRPIPAPAQQTTPANDGPLLPIAAVRIDKLDLPKIQLGAPVAGIPVALAAKAEGAAQAVPETISARLGIARIDGTPGTVTADFSFAPGAGTLDFSVRANEPRGGIIARLAGIDELPALDLDLAGSGPLADWGARLGLALDGHPTVSGTARLTAATDTKRRLTIDLDGDLAPLVPPIAGALFQGTTRLAGTADLSGTFQPLAGSLSIQTGTLQVSASGNLDPATQALTGLADVTLAAGGDALIGIETGAGLTTLKRLTASARLDGTLDRATWHASVETDTLAAPAGQLASARMDATGVGASFRPGAVSVPLSATLRFAGLSPQDPRLASFAGASAAELAGRLTVENGTPVLRLARGSASLPVLSLQLGESEISLARTRVTGDLRLPDLATLAPLAGQPLAGSLGAGFRTDLNLNDPSGTVVLSLAGTDLAAGIAPLDSLLAGKTQATANVTLANDGTLGLRDLALTAPGATLSGDAELKRGDGDGLDGDLRLVLPDLGKLDPRLGGSLTAEAELSGALARPGLDLTATSQRILLAGTPLTDLSLAVAGEADPAAPRGELNLSASLNGAPLVARGDLSSRDGRAELSGFEAAVGSNRLTGTLTVADLARALESVSGTLSLNAPDLSELSPLALTPLAGRLTAQATLSADAKGPRIALTAEGSGLGLPEAAVESLKVDANLFDLLAVPQATGTAAASGIVAGGTRLASLSAQASSDGSRTDFTLDARLPGAARDGVAAGGNLTATPSGFDLVLAKLDGSYSGLKTSLVRPARLSYAGAIARLDEIALALGSGSLVITGTAGERLDLSGTLKAVPVALANAVSPGLGLGGSLSGTVKVTGPASAPTAAWQLTGSGLSASALASNGIAPLGLDSRGTFSGQRIEQTSRISGDGGLSLSASGPVTLGGAGALALDLSGTVPLSVARLALTRSGFRGEGTLAVSGRVGGSFSAPDYALTARPQGLSFTELSSGFTLRDITGTLDVTRDRIVVNGVTAAIAAGGTVEASGSVGLSQGMPADLTVTVDNGRYSDGRIVSADLGAALKITGPLAGGGVLSGSVNIQDANIAIPQSLPGGLSPLAVRHVNAPKPVREQVAELQQDLGESGGTASGSAGLSLDVTVNAPSRIFVRGRGLDAELGGSLRIVGTTSAPQAVGGFSLRRGQLDVLTRRLAFSRGIATFTGSLTPTLDFVATTSASSTSVSVTISGSAADPVIALSSSPSLPQDEILAQLLFDKSMTSLSPTQIAQLAAAVSTLTGGSDQGPLAQLRKSLGLDAVDLNVAGPGGPSLSVGKYINDNIYLGVEQGTGRDSSKVKVDIDLSRNLKARGEVGATGSSKAGIYFEKEY
ncbi:translocation/assembly module TamB domain-containing protein [Pannonibacter sp.]|uniref:translocation/assembly module TamB domain-containing protein n=1 Tax=Pannonibacter sp. TaxID=1906786 RepID=UPI003F6EA30A